MKHKILLIIYFFFSFSVFSSNSGKNSDDIKIHLVTLGPGTEIFLRWGHFGILVDYPKDSKRKDIFYDYGTFSFEQGDFVKNFVNGVMTYSKERYYGNAIMHAYKLENRSITMQELNLSQKQVKTYIRKLYSEVQPKNKYYQYDQYRNNCVSEMVRYLDLLTEGEFLKNTSANTGRSFRDYSRDYVSSNYYNNLLIMFVLGAKVEYNISVNESLFLPDYTMNWADQVYINGEKGERIPLVKNTVVHNESFGRNPVIKNSKPKYLLNIIIGLALGILTLYLSRFTKFYRVSITILGIVLGFMGIIFFFMSFFTGHYYIHQNWNLIFMNPLTLLLALGGILSLIKQSKNRGLKIIQLHVDITLGFTIGMIIMKSLGLIYQENGEIICLLLPILLFNSSFKYLLKGIKKGE